jgi:hypothetical protein
MVLRGEMTSTTARPERSKTTLHNFTLPNLKWGSQRHLKCMKIDSMMSSGSGSAGDHRLRRRSPPFKFAGSIPFRFGEAERRSSRDYSRSRDAPFESVENGGEGEGIEEFRVKIMSDLKTVRDKITQSMFRKDDGVEEQEEERKTDDSGQEKEISPVKPWNLRKRRAACKEPISGIQYNSLNQIRNGFVAIEERTVNPSPPSRNDPARVVKERGGGVVEAETSKEVMRPKFSVKLSKKEIEEDFMATLGHRPPRRPKKRPRTVQKKLDSLHPGFYLTEVTLDAYKVPEETKNPQR